MKIKVWKFFLTLLVNILLTGLLLGLVEFAVRLATDRGLISYYHPIQIETFADASAQVEDWRLTHMYRDEQFVPDSVLFWKPKSGVWRYNNDGFIGKTTASLLREAKITGGCAIVAIGDSNTQGITDFSWPEELNDFYEKNGRASRVVNAGVAGYSSYQGMQLFTHRVIALSPEIVIVSFGWNDMAPDMGMPDNDFVSIHSRINDAMSVSRLYLIFRQKYSPRPINDGGYHPRVSISEYKDNLNKIILVAKQRNIKIVLLTRPYNSEHMTWNAVSPLLKGGWRKYIYDYNNVVRELAQNHGVSLIDFAEQFSSDSANFLDDSHFASDSSRVAALRVFEGLNSDVKKCK